MRFIYLILICFIAPVAAFVAWLRGLSDPTRRERMADRFGRPAIVTTAPVIWVHAASMGEVQAGAILVRRLLDTYPRHEIVMTTMTSTGAARVKSLFPIRVTHCFLPYDLPFAVRGFLDRVRPRAGIIMETELWPSLLIECVRRRIPLTVASARISPRTAARYRRFAMLFREALHDVTVAAQSQADAERFRDAGALRVSVTGNIKFDIDISDSIRASGAALRAQIGQRFVWVAGSTHDGEERAALNAHRCLLANRQDAFLVLAPRHPQRFDEVRSLLDREGVKFATRSRNQPLSLEISVMLLDTMGELLSCYAAANLAFVGGTLVPVGGHNLLEPAALAVPVICGRFVSNTQDAFDRLNDAGAIVQALSPDALASELVRLAGDAEARRSMGARAKQVVDANRGAMERTMTIVAARLPN